MRLRVWTLASISELRIWRCCELWHQLTNAAQIPCCCGCGIGGSYSSDSTPSLEPPYAAPMALKAKEKKKRKSIFQVYLIIELPLENTFPRARVLRSPDPESFERRVILPSSPTFSIFWNSSKNPFQVKLFFQQAPFPLGPLHPFKHDHFLHFRW